MENRMIKVDVQLHKNKQGYYLEKPKTTAGFRTVPMTDKAYESFFRLIQNRTKKQAEKIIEGQRKYLCFGRNNLPRYGTQWDKIFDNIWKKFQKSHETPIVKVTPHICRHTFATNMAISGMNPAILKQILGHDDISTTFSIYTHIKEDSSMEEFKKLGLINMNKETKGNAVTCNQKIIHSASWIA